MKIATLKERIEKKTATIEKKRNTIGKKTKQIEKKSELVRNLGYDPNGDRYQAQDTANHHEVYWTMCDIENLKDDIKRLNSEITECEETLAKYEKQLAGEMEKEATYIKEVPDIMKTLEADLIREWDEYDKNRRDYLIKEYKELGYNAFIKKHNCTDYEFRFKTDEDIHKANESDARFFILDLLNRVKEVTGEVTDWDDIRLEYGNAFPVLNGIVKGKEGTAVVESIYAGGYNIQRLHIRTLVKAF